MSELQTPPTLDSWPLWEVFVQEAQGAPLADRSTAARRARVRAVRARRWLGHRGSRLDAVGSEGVRVHKLAVRAIPHSGKPDELIDYYGIGARSIVEATQHIIK